MKKIFTPDFLIVPYELLNTPGLTPSDWIVFSVVYWFEKMKEGKCIASNETIAAIAKIGSRTVRRSLEKLEKAGCLKRFFFDTVHKKRKMIKILISFKKEKTVYPFSEIGDILNDTIFKPRNIGLLDPPIGLTDPTPVGSNCPQNETNEIYKNKARGERASTKPTKDGLAFANRLTKNHPYWSKKISEAKKSCSW